MGLKISGGGWHGGILGYTLCLGLGFCVRNTAQMRSCGGRRVHEGAQMSEQRRWSCGWSWCVNGLPKQASGQNEIRTLDTCALTYRVIGRNRWIRTKKRCEWDKGQSVPIPFYFIFTSPRDCYIIISIYRSYIHILPH